MCVVCEIENIECMTDAEKVKVLRYALECVRDGLDYNNRIKIINYALKLTK